MESNMQKMREALENSNGLLEELGAIGEWGESGRGQIVENNAALSEPPRNCDRFKTADEAWNAYDEWVESFRVNRIMPPYNVFGWLLAPAD